MTDLVDGAAAGGSGVPAPAAWGEPLTRTISWYDPAVAHEAAKRMNGLEYVRALASGEVPAQPMASVIPVRILAVEDGEVQIACRPDPSLLNLSGIVHGGVLCTLMDTAMGLAARTVLGVGQANVSIELKVSFFKPIVADGRDVRLEGRVLKRGQRICFSEGRAFSPDGVLVGHGTGSLATIEV
jgi:uncharacterized protein (TIGR00369 family)